MAPPAGSTPRVVRVSNRRLLHATRRAQGHGDQSRIIPCSSRRGSFSKQSAVMMNGSAADRAESGQEGQALEGLEEVATMTCGNSHLEETTIERSKKTATAKVKVVGRIEVPTRYLSDYPAPPHHGDKFHFP